MDKITNKIIIPNERIISRIFLIRGKKVMLDRDLAELYGVETSQLARQVRRNIKRFPNDFMFQLSKDEFKNLMCQIGISSWGGTRKLPLVFTEQGVAMLSGVLNSDRAIKVNIQIMRAFIQIRQMLATNEEVKRKIDELENKYKNHDQQFKMVFEAIKQLIVQEEKPKTEIGFKAK